MKGNALRSDALAGAALLGLPVMDVLYGAGFPTLVRALMAASSVVLLVALLRLR